MRITQRHPDVDADRLFRDFVPPPRFEGARFDTYDPQHPTQTLAQSEVRRWATARPRRWFHKKPPGPSAIYLDGGFGVGKTHLLVAALREGPHPRAFMSFSELTFAIGLLGMDAVTDRFGRPGILCIDEFELDDPGNTQMVATFLERTMPKGLRIATTSNTPPKALGAGRFHVDHFRNRLSRIADSFHVISVDGDDYRHRSVRSQITLPTSEYLTARFRAFEGRASMDSFPEVIEHLARIHPMRFAALLDNLDAVFLDQLHPLPDEATALRFAHFIDKLYDRQIALYCSGCTPFHLFEETWMVGPFAKKYGRTLSRMVELLNEHPSGENPTKSI